MRLISLELRESCRGEQREVERGRAGSGAADDAVAGVERARAAAAVVVANLSATTRASWRECLVTAAVLDSFPRCVGHRDGLPNARKRPNYYAIPVSGMLWVQQMKTTTSYGEHDQNMSMPQMCQCSSRSKDVFYPNE